MSCMGAFRGLKVTQESTAVSESSMWKLKILRQWLVCLRRSYRYSERFLIEVKCNVDTAYTNGSQHAEQNEKNHFKKSNQKVECTDNGYNRCLGGDVEKYGGKDVCAS